MSEDKPDSSPDSSRRGALGTIVVVGSAAYAGALIVPGVQFVTDVKASGPTGKEQWKRVAKLDQLKDGVPQRVKVTGEERDAFTVTKGQTLGSVWLQRAGDAVRALSATCPHLGCAIDLNRSDTNADAKSFTCPCHTSRFTLDGKAESGPSPRAMDELATRIVEGFVEVDFRRYRQGVQEKVEA